jgi:hypothetical protein
LTEHRKAKRVFAASMADRLGIQRESRSNPRKLKGAGDRGHAVVELRKPDVCRSVEGDNACSAVGTRSDLDLDSVAGCAYLIVQDPEPELAPQP